MKYSEFKAKEHDKRVAHFIRFIEAANCRVDIEDAMEVFGFCKKDAMPIYMDAVAINMANHIK